MDTARTDTAQRPKRSPLRIGLTSGIFIAAAILVALVLQQTGVDRRLFIMILALLAGVFILFQVVRHSPKNKREAEDEARTCAPIVEAYRKSGSVDRLMDDYATWKKGEHTTYTRMHFAEQIIDELSDARRFETALDVLYEVGGLPLKAREHYDYDKYRSACEAQLLEAIQAQKKH